MAAAEFLGEEAQLPATRSADRETNSKSGAERGNEHDQSSLRRKLNDSGLEGSTTGDRRTVQVQDERTKVLANNESVGHAGHNIRSDRLFSDSRSFPENKDISTVGFEDRPPNSVITKVAAGVGLVSLLLTLLLAGLGSYYMGFTLLLAFIFLLITLARYQSNSR